MLNEALSFSNLPSLSEKYMGVHCVLEDFTEEVDVNKSFHYLNLKSFSGPDGLSNLPHKFGALSAVFTYFSLLKRSSKPMSHTCGLSFSYLKKLVCEHHIKAFSDFAARVFGVHQHPLHKDLSKAKRLRRLLHIRTRSFRHHREFWLTGTQGLVITCRTRFNTYPALPFLIVPLFYL